MAKYTLSNKAVDDLSSIWEYTFNTWSTQQADTYYQYLIDTCRALADKEIEGRPYDFADLSVLGYRANRHIVFYYRIENEELIVLRILHTRMDLRQIEL